MIRHLEGALCRNRLSFVDSNLTDAEARLLVSICNECPALDPCRRLREQTRHEDGDYLRGFSGVWGGTAYSRGRPRKFTRSAR